MEYRRPETAASSHAVLPKAHPGVLLAPPSARRAPGIAAGPARERTPCSLPTRRRLGRPCWNCTPPACRNQVVCRVRSLSQSRNQVVHRLRWFAAVRAAAGELAALVPHVHRPNGLLPRQQRPAQFHRNRGETSPVMRNPAVSQHDVVDHPGVRVDQIFPRRVVAQYVESSTRHGSQSRQPSVGPRPRQTRSREQPQSPASAAGSGQSASPRRNRQHPPEP